MTQRYRPSNGTEGHAFIEHFCGRCVKDEAYRHGGDSCPIVANTLAYGIDDPRYPREWIEDDDGSDPRCTAFEPTSRAGHA